MKGIFVSAAAVAALAGAAAAQTRTIDFSTDAGGAPIPDGTPIAAQYTPWGATFVQGGLSGPSGGPGPNWATLTDMTASTDGGAGVPAGAGNFIHSFDGWLSEDGDPIFTINFSSAIDSIKADFYGVGVSGGFGGMRAFRGGTQVASVTLSGATSAETLSISGVGQIDKVLMIPGNFDDWVGVDNIVFNVVPTPGAAALMGLAGLFAARRRR